MGLKSLMERLQSRAADTPDTSQLKTGYQHKTPIQAGCTPDTPDTSCFIDTRPNKLNGQFGEPVSDPALEPAADPTTWRELAKAYRTHHHVCRRCIAAGRGSIYGLRCGVGTALWNSYRDSV